MRLRSWIQSLFLQNERSTKKIRRQRWQRAAFAIRLFLETLEARVCPATYNYDVVAQTNGQPNSQPTSTVNLPGTPPSQGQLTTIANSSVSLNNSGNVAFLGGITAANGINYNVVTEATNITSTSSSLSALNFGTPDLGTRDFENAQIADNGNVIAQDQYDDGSSRTSFIRIWKNGSPGGPLFVAQGSVNDSTQYGEEVLHPAISPNGAQVAYQQVDPLTGALTLFNGEGPLATFPLGSRDINEQIANNGAIVVQDGSASNSPIMVYQQGKLAVPIADTKMGFITLGSSPSISADGQVVVFYGYLVDPSILNANQVNDSVPALLTGEGIFASINTSAHGRVIVQIACDASTTPVQTPSGVGPGETFIDTNHDGTLDNGEQVNLGVYGFVPDDPIAVNSTESTQQSVTIAYMAYDYTDVNNKITQGPLALWVNRLDFLPNGSFRDNIDSQVCSVGDAVTGIGAVTGITMNNHAINDTNQVAFAVSTNQVSTAIVLDPEVVPVLAVPQQSQANQSLNTIAPSVPGRGGWAGDLCGNGYVTTSVISATQTVITYPPSAEDWNTSTANGSYYLAINGQVYTIASYEYNTLTLSQPMPSPPVQGTPFTIYKSIQAIGCKLTCFSMLLNYAGITSLNMSGQNAPMDPGYLNQLLVAQGVFTGHSDLNNNQAVVRAAVQSSASGSFDNLSWIDFNTNNISQLTSELYLFHEPILAQVTGGGYGQHYVVITGETGEAPNTNESASGGSNIEIFDPGTYSRTLLSDYTLVDTVGFIDDPTVFSDLNVSADGDANNVSILVTNPQGQAEGSDPNSGAEIDQIGGAVTYTEAADQDINDPPSSNSNQIVDIPAPVAGVYTIQVSGQTAQTAFTLYISGIASDGTIEPMVIDSGTVSPGSPAIFTVNYSAQAPVSQSQSRVTASPATIPEDGAATIMLTANDAIGNQEPAGGLTVSFGLGDGTGSGTFGPVTDNGNGTYTATFTGTFEGANTITASIDGQPVTSTAPMVSVAVAPVITTNPASQVGSAGNPVAFTADAVGDPDPTVQWQVSINGGNTFTDIAGATSTTLTLTTTAEDNDNEYQAVFTNSSGTATSAPAYLTVNAAQGGLVISSSTGVFPQFDLAQPANTDGAQDFGVQVLSLSTGNIVVTAPVGNGAVYLFDGETGALISELTGVSGCSVTALSNGNFVVDTPGWYYGTGAVTWGSGITGVNGTPNASNSLIGSTVFDSVGGFDASTGSGGITALDNGNYVVDSPAWGTDGIGVGGLGAVTWCNGTTGTDGYISAANSLVGSNPGDDVGGADGLGGITALTNGNYVVDSPYWGGDVGAVSWGNGITGTSSVVSALNSLIGSTTDTEGSPDYVGWGGVTALANGNYVVDSEQWNDQEGAATWGNGTMGIDGTISAINSLVGSNAAVPSGGEPDSVGIGGITALSNGNYVVDSPDWSANAGSGDFIGAVTWGSGTTGVTGAVSASNSLVGDTPADNIGGGYGVNGGVTALADGNYVVYSPNWNDQEGAATWGNGTAGITGPVSDSNSLVGSDPGDEVSGGGVTALANGDYVVDSPFWDGGYKSGLGAVTWGDGTAGITGTISEENSLVGSFHGDEVGGGIKAATGAATHSSALGGGVVALANGDYVVDSPGWYAQSGAVTWGDGITGISGTVSAADSLIGDHPGEEVGSSLATGSVSLGPTGVTPLANGNFVVMTPSQAAATWGNGTTGIQGSLSTVPSLTGATGVDPLPNGDYFVPSEGGLETWVDGTTSTTLDGQNSGDPQNSFTDVGSPVPLDGGSEFIAANSGLGQVAVGFTDPNLLTYALAQGQTIDVTPQFITNYLNAGNDVTIQANDDMTIDSPIDANPISSAGNLALDAGRSIMINADINTAGGDLNLTANDSVADGVINSERDPGDADITQATGTNIDTGGGAFTVDLMNGADKTNDESGAVTLSGVDAPNTSLSSTLGVAINGTTPGDGIAAGTYTQISFTGAVDLDNAPLSIDHTTVTPEGSTFVILEATGGITGTFDGLSEGSTVTAPDGTEFTISYQGDGGQELILTQINEVFPGPPIITLQPSNQGLMVGAQVTFTAAATGFPAPTVQWQVSFDGGNSFSDIPGATSTTLSFTTQADQDGDEYQAVFTNDHGTAATHPATLALGIPPTVTLDPADQLVAAGSAVTLTAAASGSPAPAIQWQVSTDDGANFYDIPDATSSTLNFAAIAARSGELFQAVFTNSIGSETTEPAAISILSAPAITSQPVNQIVAVNGTASFTAAASGNPVPTIQWQEEATGATVFTNLNGQTSATLSLSSATLADNGDQYQAVFSNSQGTVISNVVTLDVDVPPRITTQPISEEVSFGRTVKFTAAASGPAVKIQWQVLLPNASTFVDIHNATSSTLTFKAPSKENGAQYRAVFTNASGEAITNAATLTVNVAPPVFLAQPVSQAVGVNGNATFTVEVDGNPLPTIQWQVKETGKTSFYNLAGQTTSTLSLSDVTQSESGNQYRAVLTNKFGSSTSDVATLVVETLPRITKQPVAQVVANDESVTFQIAFVGVGLSVQWQELPFSGSNFSDIAGATSSKLTFKAQSIQNAAQFRVILTNAAGQIASNAAALTVKKAPPTMTTQPVNQTVAVNGTATFTAVANGNPTPTIQWQEKVVGATSFTSLNGQTSTTLNLANLSPSESGNQYRAVFTSPLGTVISSAVTLTVDFPVQITTQPQGALVEAGAEATLTAAATGTDMDVQWQVSTDGGATFTNLIGETSAALTVSTTNMNGEYLYRAVFTNELGQAITDDALLVVW